MIDFELPARPATDPDQEDSRLLLAAESAVELVPGCDHASLTVVEGRDLVTHAASGSAAGRADLLQRLLADGPAWDALRSRRDVVGHDLTTEERWPRWTGAVRSELGLAAAVSFWVCAGGRSYGALNLYGCEPHAFGPADLQTAGALAARIGVGIDAGRRWDAIDGPHPDLAVGQAQGIVMERLGVDPVDALDVLRQAACEQGTQLAQLAAQVVRTRRIPLALPERASART